MHKRNVVMSDFVTVTAYCARISPDSLIEIVISAFPSVLPKISTDREFPLLPILIPVFDAVATLGFELSNKTGSTPLTTSYESS